MQNRPMLPWQVMQRSSIGKFVKCCSFYERDRGAWILEATIVGSCSGLHPLLERQPLLQQDSFLSRLMTLLVHLRVRAVGRLRVAAAVTIGAVVDIGGEGDVLSHALRQTGALRAVLRPRRAARSSGLVADGGKLGMTRRLPWHSDGLSHLTIDGRLGAILVRGAMVLFGGSVPLFIGLARCFFLLLFRFPFFSDFFKLY
jgi:hypothetical protein